MTRDKQKPAPHPVSATRAKEPPGSLLMTPEEIENSEMRSLEKLRERLKARGLIAEDRETDP